MGRESRSYFVDDRKYIFERKNTYANSEYEGVMKAHTTAGLVSTISTL